MKKVWNDATLVELDITATATGPIKAEREDGPIYWSEEGQTQVVPKGKHNNSESPL